MGMPVAHTTSRGHQRATQLATRRESSFPKVCRSRLPARLVAFKAGENPDTQSESQQQSKPSPSEDGIPIWEVREEANKKVAAMQEKEPPAILWLGWAVISAIVAVGSVYEYVNEKAVFRLIEPTSQWWRPTLTFFVVGGFGTAWFSFKEGLALYNLQEKRKDAILKSGK